MLSSAGKEELGDKKKNATVSSFGKKRPISDRTTKRTGLSHDLRPIRKEKVREAKKKKQNGDYDSQEVYRKIADRLIDLFGI